MNVTGLAWQVYSDPEAFRKNESAGYGCLEEPETKAVKKKPFAEENKAQEIDDAPGDELASSGQQTPLERYFDGLLEKRKQKEADLQEKQKEQELQKQELRSEAEKQEKDRLLEEMLFHDRKDVTASEAEDNPLDAAFNKKRLYRMFGVHSEAAKLSGLHGIAVDLSSVISILESEQHMDSAWKKRHGLWQKKNEMKEREKKHLEQRLFETEAETLRRYESLQKNIRAIQKMKMTNGEQRREESRPKSVYERTPGQNRLGELQRQSALKKQLSALWRAGQYGRLTVDTLF